MESDTTPAHLFSDSSLSASDHFDRPANDDSCLKNRNRRVVKPRLEPVFQTVGADEEMNEVAFSSAHR